ncbi:hypothetical protein D6T65_15780 [Arthrobacter frigidicola]|nr:hypothetical protein D6T65_15780 [Arthrobacter frigidicola]
MLMFLGQQDTQRVELNLALIYLLTHIGVGLATLGIRPSPKSLVMLVTPGVLFAVIWVGGGFFWAVAWILGLTAWGLLSGEASGPRPDHYARGFAWFTLGLIGAALLLLLTVFVPNIAAYILAVIPVIKLLLGVYSDNRFQGLCEISLGAALLVLIFVHGGALGAQEVSAAGVAATAGIGLVWVSRNLGRTTDPWW